MQPAIKTEYLAAANDAEAALVALGAAQARAKAAMDTTQENSPHDVLRVERAKPVPPED